MTCLLAIENCDDLTGTTTTASYTVFDNLLGDERIQCRAVSG